MKSIFSIIIVSLITLNLFSQTASRLANSPFPVSQIPDTLYVVDMEYYTPDQKLTTITLQGMLAKTKPMIFCWDLSGYGKWIDDFNNNYNVHIDSTYWHDFNGLITHFKNNIGGYYICDLDTNSTNVAITACGLHSDKIAVTTNIEPLMTNLGIPLEYDVRNLDEQWMLTNATNLSTKIISYQNHSKSTFLGDYTVFSGAFQFFDDINAQLTTDAFLRMDDNAILFGWGIDERETVEKASENTINVVPADWARNISVMSNFEATTIQHVHSDSIINTDNVHTVCFLMSDGDNINWYLHEFADTNRQEWYGSSERGHVDIGWTISASFSELAPTIMKYVYDRASNTSNAQDYFVASTSGLGYMYPNLYPNLNSSTNLLNEYMNKADLNILNIIGTQYNDNDMLPFLQQPNIDAIFYYGYDSYADNGDIRWINNKPVIEGRYNFWDGFNTVQQLANKLNNESTDAHSQDGYSLIPVHAWSRTVADINAVAELLDSNVIIVTPEEFVQRIQAKLGTTTSSKKLINKVNINIYPNPAKEKLYVDYYNSNLAYLLIYNNLGELILDKTIYNHKNTIDISNFNNGLYIIKIIGDNEIYTKSIIIR